jgi:hypothetical protein
MDEQEKAFEYYKARLTHVDNRETWISFAVMAKNLGFLVEYEEAIIRCIELEPASLELKIIYSSIKWFKGRTSDAINYMNNIITSIGIKNTNAIFNIFLAFLYKESGKELLSVKHIETAKRFKMKEVGMIQISQKSKILLIQKS